MEILVEDLYDLSLGLSDLAEKELQISTALKIEQNHQNVSKELVSTDKIRKKLIDKYKDYDLDDGGVQLKKDKINDYHKELDELMKEKVEINLKEINLDELEGIKIKPRSIKFLNKILIQDNAE